MADLVILDRVVEGALPEYCTHGYTFCIVCGSKCWMGSETSKVLAGGQVLPLCLTCAPSVIGEHEPATNLRDHRRADGPHE